MPICNGFEVRVGCDVQSIDDIRAAIEANAERYLRRVLGEQERVEASELVTIEQIARYTSGRFAAKEAVYKALRGHPDVALGWPQIEILADDLGAPRVHVRGAAAELCAANGIAHIAVSISHAPPFAFAVATAVATA